MNRIFTRVAPILSILSFIVGFALYLYAAHRYSEGAVGVHADKGYHHLRSYWCELYSTITNSGTENAGLFIAKASTLGLVGCLFFFWLAVPVLFSEFKVLTLVVRIAGVIASIAASLIFTELHDIVITLAVPLGFAAILGTCIGLARKKEYLLFIMAIIAVSVGTDDYVAWKLEVWKDVQPYIQKCAMLLIFGWVIWGSVKVLLRPAAKTGEPVGTEGFPIIASP